MDQKSYPSHGILLLAIGLASGCASSNSASTPTYAVASSGDVEMIVLNRSTDPVTVFAWWEGGARVRLGELRGGHDRTFSAPYRGREVWLSLDVLAAGRGLQFAGPDDSPQEFVPVAPGDRLEWEIRSTQPVDLFYRVLPSN